MRNYLGNRKKIIIDKENIIPIGCVKQFDDVTLKLDLKNKSNINFDVTGQTLLLICKKANNEIEELFNTSIDTPITFNKSEVDIKLRNSMFNTPGTVKFELNIKKWHRDYDYRLFLYYSYNIFRLKQNKL